ncbi:hypothetical protein BC629DRAFT_1302176 [Irpex lacteus]|nr:hypothetical protein BC629DRAFT_1302176 [Irpex lacteus]
MHLGGLNLPDLFLSLWRGTITCDRTLGDDKSTWDWAVFRDDVLWKRHGEQVAAATPYLPGSFDRPPRNPAEKLTSGYKAMEFLIYIYGLGPGLLYGVLPMAYWKNFCKLVRGIRIVHQKTVKDEELTEADKVLLEFCVEFEQLYYQRNPARIHFVRQSIHAVAHLTSETTRIGPYAGVTQWTMENAIGNLGREIRQPSNAYANLSQRALRRCQVNALKAMLPELDPPKPLPRVAEDVGGGYVLLHKRERAPRPVTDAEADVLRDCVLTRGIPAASEWMTRPTVSRWARVRLPTGQVARSLWKEEGTPLSKLRMARNVKIIRDGVVDFAEVKYYFRLPLPGNPEGKAFAMVDLYSRPDEALLRESSNTLWSCHKQAGNAGLCVVELAEVFSVVAMVPHPPLLDPTLGNFTGRVFVVEKIGLDVMTMVGIEEEDIEPDEESES